MFESLNATVIKINKLHIIFYREDIIERIKARTIVLSPSIRYKGGGRDDRGVS